MSSISFRSLVLSIAASLGAESLQLHERSKVDSNKPLL